jgi:outer membrane receptor protein involved in Fe transport
VQYVHNVDPLSKAASGAYWNDVGPGTDQTFDARWTTDIVITWKAKPGIAVSVGSNNLFDIYPERVSLTRVTIPLLFTPTPQRVR